MCQPFIKKLSLLLLAGGLSASFASNAEFVTSEKNAEANQVRILIAKDAEEGQAIVTECQGCPLNLRINQKTQFFQNRKVINRHKAESLSGKPATIIYSQDGKQALRILW